MKKIFTPLMVLSLTALSYAQINDLSATSTSSLATSTEAVNEVIVSQVGDQQDGIVSDIFVEFDNAGVFAADDFNMPFDGKLTKLIAFGFNNGANFLNDTEGVNFYIMADDNGSWLPDSSNPALDALYKLEVPLGNPALTYEAGTIILDLEVLGENIVLPEGEKYWLSVTPVMVGTGGDGTLRWNWLMSSQEGADAESMLIDPDDLFGEGLLDWTPISSLGLDAGNLAMQVEGVEAELGVKDLNAKATFLVYPNPATNFVKVRIDGSDVKEISVLSLDGKKVASSESDTVRVTSLPNGVYLVKVLDSNGNTHTSKVVKK